MDRMVAGAKHDNISAVGHFRATKSLLNVGIALASFPLPNELLLSEMNPPPS
jgi:hypothetical protein